MGVAFAALSKRIQKFRMRKYFSRNYVIPSPKSSKDQKKKVFTEKKKEFLSPKSGEDQKKISFLDHIWPEFVGFICSGWLYFVWSSSAQISICRP